MKIIRLLPALLLSGIVSGAAAQGVSIGPKIGANFSTFSVSAYNISTPIGEQSVDEWDKDKEQMVGAQAGLMVNLGISEAVSFQPELLYSAKGYKQGGTFDGKDREMMLKMNYFEVPLLFKVAVGSENFKGHLMLGPYVAYLLGGEDQYSLGGEDLHKRDLEFEFTDQNSIYHFQRADYGGTIGAGVTMKAGTGSLVLDARYSMGIPEVVTFHPSLSDTAVRLRNSTFGVSLGWLYHFPYTAKPAEDYGGVFLDN